MNLSRNRTQRFGSSLHVLLIKNNSTEVKEEKNKQSKTSINRFELSQNFNSLYAICYLKINLLFY